ncbi:hypothetical protein AGMMS50262_15400 [Bacteroidia bacterium]|nr:hypothetical protein AGMMS50262_15400 [Bacteroidia bacterium]
MVKNKRKYLFLLLIGFSLTLYAQRQTNYGAIFSGELEKGLTPNLSLSLGEEVRLIDNSVGFDRSSTSVGLDYAFLQKKIKVGAYYNFMYLYNSDHYYEPRHRYYFNLSYKEAVGQFTLSWRGRFQGTYRDENHGEYKINPKYVMKNKFEVEYSVWGHPWKPFISCDFTSELNDPTGNDLTRVRYEGGTTWRLNRTDYLNFFVRFDQYLTAKDPHVLSLGVGYKVKL